MTYTTTDIAKQALEKFRRFDADTKLALLWYGYLDIKDQLSPGTQPDVEAPAIAVYDQIKALPKQEQLQAQRDIVNCANTPITQAYSALHSSPQLFVWLRLAQGMERNEIITVPENYNLPEQTNEFVNQVKQLDFEQRLNFMRSVVIEMGASPRQ